jgi:acetyl esterase/lipase
MKVSNEMIKKEIRTQGLLLKKAIPFWKEKTFRRMNYIQRMQVGKCKVDLNYQEVYIEDGLRLCLYSRKELTEPSAVILYMHGGGYAMGAPENGEDFYLRLCDALDVIVVAPDYTLSLDEPYPKALNDCYQALEWISSTNEYMFDLSRVIIAGDSAGGGLCCALSILARDKSDINILCQVPLYPMIDSSMSSDSAMDNDAPVWNTLSSEVAWRLYLGDHEVDCYNSPSTLENFEGLPPLVTFVGSLDPFLDETIKYVEKLKDVGVEAKIRIFEGCYHGFERVVPKADVSKEANNFIIEELAKILDKQKRMFY